MELLQPKTFPHQHLRSQNGLAVEKHLGLIFIIKRKGEGGREGRDFPVAETHSSPPPAPKTVTHKYFSDNTQRRKMDVEGGNANELSVDGEVISNIEGTVDSELKDGKTARKPRRTDIKKKGIPSNPEEILDPVELILRNRVKKFNVNVPLEVKFNNGHQSRSLLISDDDMTHLMGQMDGSKYGTSERPELTLMRVGKDTASIDFIADLAKETYFFTATIEDDIVYSYSQDRTSLDDIQRAVCRSGDDIFECVDLPLRRKWRRFVKTQILLLALDVERIARIRKQREEEEERKKQAKSHKGKKKHHRKAPS